MTARRAAGFDLRKVILDPGFTPRARDAAPLLDLVAEGGDPADAAERALLRLGAAAHAEAIQKAGTPGGPGRPALVRLLGRLGAAQPDPAVTALLVRSLDDADERVRRAAALALGRVRPPEAEAALVAAAARETSASARRALIEALGKVGGEAARAAVGAAAQDPEVARERARAALMIDRTAARAEPSRIDATRALEVPVRVALRCRAGLEPILLEELPPSLEARFVRDAPGGVRIEATLRGPLAELFAARTMLSFGLVLPPQRVTSGADPTAAIVDALTSKEALAILERFTEGPIRYRLAFDAGGKRRALVWRVAEETAKRAPALTNDPTESPWEAVVYEAAGLLRVELVPGLPDPRFAYRTGDVPAASHPTIAAALVRVSEPRPDDVVWDPFAGSGLELCERGLAGPWAALTGSDLDERALGVAKANLEAAGVRGATLLQGDATRLVPPGPLPTRIITNPPLGRRVQRGAGLAPMLDRFVEHAARVLAPGGRLAWISPFPERTRAVALARGLVLLRAHEVDLGGFAAEMQVLRRLAGGRG